jgi:hypothetical protein
MDTFIRPVNNVLLGKWARKTNKVLSHSQGVFCSVKLMVFMHNLSHNMHLDCCCHGSRSVSESYESSFSETGAKSRSSVSWLTILTDKWIMWISLWPICVTILNSVNWVTVKTYIYIVHDMTAILWPLMHLSQSVFSKCICWTSFVGFFLS